jgi:hypothetical protein
LLVSPCFRSRMILSFLGDVPGIGEFLRAIEFTLSGRYLPWIIPAPTSAWIQMGVPCDHLGLKG